MTEPTTQQQKQFKVLLIGDYCVDEYQYGTVDRISPEAPVPIFKYEETVIKHGMAGNVKCNLDALNIDVDFYRGHASKKTRFVDKRSRQQLIRMDHDIVSYSLDADMMTDLEKYDAIVISDYNKGFVTYECIESLRKRYAGPMFLDTKKSDLSRFKGIYVKINELEFSKCTSINDSLIVTLGENGAMYNDGFGAQKFDSPKVGVSDVTGAGDTFLSALTYKYLHTKNISVSIGFAIRASSITVQHFGCYAPKLEEICG
jgi:D-beta-D-heptose 7-phosphate kinase/D-beta-D-heptose 1-phosphate adenosyltransferase